MNEITSKSIKGLGGALKRTGGYASQPNLLAHEQRAAGDSRLEEWQQKKDNESKVVSRDSLLGKDNQSKRSNSSDHSSPVDKLQEAKSEDEKSNCQT